MTRLNKSDIRHISSGLEEYNRELQTKTGRTLLGIACHAYGKNEIQVKHRINSFSIHVIPVTAGQGIITDFSETVTAILQFLGFNALTSDNPDTSGIAHAFESKADAVMMADDKRFVGINLNTRVVADNSEATGRVFASVLDLMAGGIKDHEVLVLGCGLVGAAAARTLLFLNSRVALYDVYPPIAHSLKESLSVYATFDRIRIETDVNRALSKDQYIIEATPAAGTIPDELISDTMVVAAPGVPLGISKIGCQILKNRLVHDKLALGTAAMAVSLLS